MKSKKKLLLLGVGAMGALALGVGATSTFAWFQAGAAANMTAKSGVSAQISTENNAIVAALDLYVPSTFTVTTAVELTDAANGGITRVMSGGAVTEPTNEKDLVKSAVGKLTFATTGLKIGSSTGSAPTADQLALAFGYTSSEVSKTFDVKVSASDLVRVGIATVAGAWTDAGAANTSRNSYVAAYVADTKVTIGKVTLKYNGGTDLSGVTYAHTLASGTNYAAVEGGDTTGNYFFYSVTPNSTSAVESGVSYGTVSAFIE